MECRNPHSNFFFLFTELHELLTCLKKWSVAANLRKKAGSIGCQRCSRRAERKIRTKVYPNSKTRDFYVHNHALASDRVVLNFDLNLLYVPVYFACSLIVFKHSAIIKIS